MEELYLIYVNKIGEDWTGKHLYEFLFSDTTENVDGDDWDAYPASGRPAPPNSGFVKKVGKLMSDDLKFKLVQNSSEFAVWDAVDGVVALAWEDIGTSDQRLNVTNSAATSAGEVRITILYQQNNNLS